MNETWLGKEEPALAELTNRSLAKYKLLIDGACEWEEFQQRLAFLSTLAAKYHSDIASVSVAALLQREKIDAAIVGLSPQNYDAQNRMLTQLPLIDLHDLQEMDRWSCHLQGDAYDEERNKDSIHAKIMKYNLNSG